MSLDLKIAGAVRRRFTYQNVTLDYLLLKEERKTLAATVLPSQALVVKVPQEACKDRVDEFLQRKYRWVLKQQRYFQQFKPQSEKRFVSGETFRYRGRSYKLRVQKVADSNRVSLQHGVINVFTERPKDRKNTQRLLESWFLVSAHRVFAERLEQCFQSYDASPPLPKLVIRQMSRRWGSYSPKSNQITLNRDLIRAATRHIDYVLMHELCHMTHQNHTKAFYLLLESKLPHWLKLKTDLEQGLLG